MKLQVGDIIFYKGTSFIGRLIRKVTKSEYSHVALYVGDNKILEADRFIKSRVTAFNIEDKDLIKVMRYKRYLTKEKRQTLQLSLNLVVGKRYDYFSVLHLFIKLAFGVDKDRIVDDLNRFFCSELVDYVYSLIGIDLVPTIDNHVLTPRDLEQSPELTEVKVV